MARTSFSGPVYSEAGFLSGTGATTTLASVTVTQLGTMSAAPAGQMVYVSNAATNPVIAYSNGTIWLRSDTGAVVS